jgi:hypothetical protein
MINFPRCAPSRYRCKYCGFSPLEIWAFVFEVEYENTGKKIERAEPVLVCTNKTGRRGCGGYSIPWNTI